MTLTPEEEEGLEIMFDLLWSHPDHEGEGETDLFDIKNDGLPIYRDDDERKTILYFNSKQDFRNWLIHNAGNEEIVENMSHYTQLKPLNNFIINYNQQLPQVLQ